ncbi:thermonuclease family protein [Escherichia coli]|uniref:thermonuclease family protein n=1 Tax=Escherichia coli TaxID=562 RepID=UPI00388D16C5
MRKLILCNILILPTLFSCVEAAPAITVTRILDGDTLEVKDEGELIRIRLVDIDAPEKSQPFGQRAKQKLSELVKDADDVAVSSTGKDRYGRTLAKVYVKKCQPACLAYYVNAEMVKSGGLGLSLPWKGNQPDYGRTGEQGEAGQNRALVITRCC